MKAMLRLGSALLLVVLVASLSFGRKEEPIADLKARVQSASPEQRVGLCVEIAQRQLNDTDKLYKDGKSEEAQGLLKDVVEYADQATQAATQSGKKLKHVEIEVRKMAHKLQDMKRSVNFEDQAPIQDAADRMERMRTELLSKMFGFGKAKE
jgi:phage-related tail protein